MKVTELHEQILGAKRYLDKEIVKLKTTNSSDVSGYREITDKLDMIHEVERIGYRNLNEREMRKITRLLSDLNNKLASLN